MNNFMVLPGRSSVARVAFAGVLLIGLALVVVAGLDHFAVISLNDFLGQENGPALSVSGTDFELQDVIPGQAAQVSVRLQNRSDRTVRVFGVAEC